MNNNLKNIFIGLGVVVLAGALLSLGFFWGGVRNMHTATVYGPSMMSGYDSQTYAGRNGPGMMGNRNSAAFQGNYGGMMGGYREGYSDSYGPGMMSGFGGQGFSDGYGPGMMSGFGGQGFADGYGPGMMSGFGGRGFSDGYRPGMMSGFGATADPLSMEENHEILEAFIVENGWEGQFEIEEIMIFDNHAYAQLIEVETGIGAYELLIDAATGQVYPEHGANMMWNSKYGMHAFGEDVSEEMEVSADAAITFAQDYLDANLAGTTADDHAVPFYGYYTLHILNDGEIAGMLSVDGATGEVLLHTWHGDLIEMSDHLDE